MFDRSVDRADMSDNAWRRPIRAPSPDFLKRTQVIIGNQKPQHPAPAFLRFPQRVFWPLEIANKPFQADRPRKGGAFRFLVAWTTTGNTLGSTAISTGSLTHKLARRHVGALMAGQRSLSYGQKLPEEGFLG
jgi:hypothetical protein